jgi:FAD/FMN-containing dehydrogenase
MAKSAVEGLAGAVRGRVVESADAGYDEARALYNGMIDKRPAAIVYAVDDADVAAAVSVGRERGLRIAVRGGGHNGAGLASVDDGLVIDLSAMDDVRVDPAARMVRVQGGAKLNQVDAATHEHGFAVPAGIIGTTGVGGLTLGGGIGHLTRAFGLTIDHLLAATVVLADGSIVTADAYRDPDLFWAIRGGGGNFGVAASLTYRLHELKMITGGLIAHPIEAGPDMLRFYRDAVANLSDDLTVFAALAHAPDGSGMPLAGMIVVHTGTEEQAEADLAPFREWGSPMVINVGRMPYPVINTILDDGFPHGSLNYWLSNFTSGMPDELIDLAAERFAVVPSTMTTILFEHFHGAVTRVGVTDTAVPHREQGWNLVLPSVWTDPADTDKNIAWTRDTQAAFAEHLTEGRWLNYLADDQGEDAIRGAYGPNYARLVEVKRKVDPRNVFRQNHNIAP